jgi:hypothetical protein
MRTVSNATCKGQEHHYCSRACFYAGRRGTHWDLITGDVSNGVTLTTLR